MKRVLTIFGIAILLIAAFPAAALADKPMNDGENYNGNGAPSGKHYNINH